MMDIEKREREVMIVIKKRKKKRKDYKKKNDREDLTHTHLLHILTHTPFILQTKKRKRNIFLSLET